MIRRFLLNTFPTWAIMLISIAFFVLFALFSYWILRRYFRAYLTRGASHTSNIFMNLSTMSTVLLAFTIVALWQFYVATKTSVNNEANALSKIVILSQNLAPKEVLVINQSIKDYIAITTQQEWPLMRQGKTSPEADIAMTNIYSAVETYKPRNRSEDIVFLEIFNELHEALNERDARIEAVNSILPGAFFAIIMLNLLLLIISVNLVEEQNKKPHLTFIMFISIMVGINVSLIIAMDFPFSGSFAISTSPFYEGVLAKF